MTRKPTGLTTIQVTKDTRDRLYRLKFRKTYDEFLRELCDRYELPGSDGPKIEVSGDSSMNLNKSRGFRTATKSLDRT